MSERRTEQKNKILNQLGEMITTRVPERDVHPVIDFMQQYYRVSPVEELAERSLDNLYGATLSCWEHLQQWDGENQKVHVFNPDLERHGWHCGHTVIQILHRDMPFLVDSVRMELNRRGLSIHVVHSGVINVERDKKDARVTASGDKASREALIYIEVDRHSNADELKSIESGLAEVLAEVRVAVEDFDAMRERVDVLRKEVSKLSTPDKDACKEASEFLGWMLQNRFTFLGYEEVEFDGSGEELQVVHLSDSALGVCRLQKRDKVVPRSQEHCFLLTPQPLMFAKDDQRSRVHRPAYRDLVVIKRFDTKGNVTGECRFYGLYTSPVYVELPQNIPVLRRRVDYVLSKAGFTPGGNSAKSLAQILSDLPRDELLLSTPAELFNNAMGVFNLQERRKVRLLGRRDACGKFYTLLYYVPRDIFNTALRTQVQELLVNRLGARDSEFTTYYSESVLTRVHFVLPVDPDSETKFDLAELEAEVAELSRSWSDELHHALVDASGEERGNHLANRYRNAFPSAYREHFTPSSAVFDVEHIERLDQGQRISMSFYRQIEQSRDLLKFKLFNRTDPLVLSDIIPLLENLGMRVVGEHPYMVRRHDGERFWIHDFTLYYNSSETVDLEEVKQIFQEAFFNIWSGRAENDEFNRLVIGARLNWREVAMLRAYARYNQQIRFGFSQPYIADTLSRHLYITRLLVALFRARFEPERQSSAKVQALAERIAGSIIDALDKVDNLNDDKILRRYLELIRATLRTNYFQTNAEGEPKDYFVFKLNPHEIADIPLPRPMFEIFVYSARVEGVHLRGGKVARGGLRWSDRREDYRTEVLGLVKAQQVKNAVIVPVGAKGGFVAKQLPTNGSREEILEEGINSYKTFIRGLLDVTDNYVDGAVVPPPELVRHDEDDPYLVVAADKGTATFSDIANSIAEEFGFWLGDAFASGGSQGYDHKKMGITARGAWESVKLHFRELGIDTQTQPFTVVGIGDMAGDVFGNGMLMSEHIELVAAFNHLHIFIDPQPDAAAGFAERKRLFDLPRSSWADYNEKLISSGGGIFSRAAKWIDISPQMKKRFDIKEDRLAPNDLISALLRSQVDLIWNGGIGTYVKASFESHADVGDKANDGLRIDGRDLRCRVLGEGGNLGFTQLGRIEFSLKGGACNTDFIDNAGGVDCSDHEVNIKILLNEVVSNGDLTVKQRNNFLREMTDEVAQLVLQNNYSQALAISIAQDQVRRSVDDYRRLINELESDGRLVRALEFIPTDDVIVERHERGDNLTRPELSVLISYVKAKLKEVLTSSWLPSDEYVAREVQGAFPSALVERYGEQVNSHRLRAEILATQVANGMINRMGITYPLRMQQSTGRDVADIAAAYIAARDIFGMNVLWDQMEELDNRVPAQMLQGMMSDLQRLVRRAANWILNTYRQQLEPAQLVNQFRPGVEAMALKLAERLTGEPLEAWQARHDELVKEGVPADLAVQAASFDSLYTLLGIIATEQQTGEPLDRVADVYFMLGDRLELYRVDRQIKAMKQDSHWKSLARDGFREELNTQQRAITFSVLTRACGVDEDAEGKESSQVCVERWLEANQVLLARWNQILADLSSVSEPDSAVFAVAIRELVELAHSS
ncbi:NAD-specific glutamate dehydrogenase, large form [Marinobacterium lacunae]|uniref:NAD-specific glutamate dehydrogenase, large form n=1 Tax=Marinobacterium lacunae TaxID=1232683 RepID=A0A081FU38_9GAMM|nr:NAD-glutamate dehydrogenase [Marinobacterium lacunae]KEA62043.1 NAD-specific glutamate dehydrogenase, large form [Marinobacterium lacunae]